MGWTGLGERIIWWVVAFVILFFCAYFIWTALEWLQEDTQNHNIPATTIENSISNDHITK